MAAGTPPAPTRPSARRPQAIHLRAAPAHALAFTWLVAAMFATLLLGAAALGMYEAVLIAEVVALAILGGSYLVWRMRPAPSTEARERERRHRERRGF